MARLSSAFNFSWVIGAITPIIPLARYQSRPIVVSATARAQLILLTCFDSHIQSQARQASSAEAAELAEVLQVLQVRSSPVRGDRRLVAAAAAAAHRLALGRTPLGRRN